MPTTLFFPGNKSKKKMRKNGIDSMVQQGACCMDFPRPSWLRTFEQKGIQKDRIANVRGRMKIQEKNSRNLFFFYKNGSCTYNYGRTGNDTGNAALHWFNDRECKIFAVYITTISLLFFFCFFVFCFFFIIIIQE